ncbi:MAG: DUF2255 family protein, partial [Acidimicrobiales bacterium]
MSKWSPQELRRTGAADEVDIAPVRADGTLRPFTTIWVVRVGNDLYVRSYRGLAGGWYRTVQRSHRARLRAAGAERDVALEDTNGIEAATIDEGRGLCRLGPPSAREPRAGPSGSTAGLGPGPLLGSSRIWHAGRDRGLGAPSFHIYRRPRKQPLHC